MIKRTVSLVVLVGCSAVPESEKQANDIARVAQLADADKLYIVGIVYCPTWQQNDLSYCPKCH